MQRSELIAQLNRYQPLDFEENQHKIELISFIEEQEECFDRGLLIGHITGSAWVVNRTMDKALLTLHKKLNRWLQLGGHADGETNIMKVAAREASEESGLQSLRPLSHDIFDVDIHSIPVRKNEPEHFHYDIRFLFKADDHEKLHVSSESKTLGWVSFDQLSERTQANRSILRMAEKVKKTRSRMLRDLNQP